MPYIATVNVPGYLPMDDEPPAFNTAAEAWAYLEAEREQDEADATEGHHFVASDCLTELRRIAEGIQYAMATDAPGCEGVVYGDTPGYEGDHDLGLAYCVTWVDDYPDDYDVD